MSKHRITDKVTFACQSCGSKNLLSTGAVKTEEEKIYFTYTCEDCREVVPISVDNATVALYGTPVADGSKLVN